MERPFTKCKRILPKKENFFVSYALRGSIANPYTGARYGSPDRYPIDGPVHEPSPLNVQYKFDIPYSLCGVL